jgi:hypothetical protein
MGNRTDASSVGTAIICPIYKQGDKLDCRKYRGISLLNVTYKIFTNLLTRYIEPYIEEILGDYHCGFRIGSSNYGSEFLSENDFEETM